MWWTKGKALRGVALIAVAVGGLQLAPGPARLNPPVTRSLTLQGATSAPPHVEILLRRACMDCHSNETRWPWYSRLAPLSWAVAKDVTRARRALNLSEWGSRAGERPAIAVGYLTAMCAGVQQNRMPPPRYRFLHSGARLSPDEKATICSWTEQESSRILDTMRRRL